MLGISENCSGQQVDICRDVFQGQNQTSFSGQTDDLQGDLRDKQKENQKEQAL